MMMIWTTQAICPFDPKGVGAIITYNAQSCRKKGRMEQILGSMKYSSVVSLTGTRFKAKKDIPIEVIHIAGFFGVLAGYGDRSNSHGGVAICFNMRFFKKENVISYNWAIGQIQGRGLAVRIKRGCIDWLVTAQYWYPMRNGFCTMNTVAVNKWQRKVLEHCPIRTMPVVTGDINGRTGKVKEGNHWKVIDDDHCGPAGAVCENKQGYEFRMLCKDCDLCILNTIQGPSKTYYSSSGRETSRIDYIAVPIRYKSRVGNVCVKKALGWRIQNSDCQKQIDHVPLQADMPTYNLDFSEAEDQQMVA